MKSPNTNTKSLFHDNNYVYIPLVQDKMTQNILCMFMFEPNDTCSGMKIFLFVFSFIV